MISLDIRICCGRFVGPSHTANGWSPCCDGKRFGGRVFCHSAHTHTHTHTHLANPTWGLQPSWAGAKACHTSGTSPRGKPRHGASKELQRQQFLGLGATHGEKRGLLKKKEQQGVSRREIRKCCGCLKGALLFVTDCFHPVYIYYI